MVIIIALVFSATMTLPASPTAYANPVEYQLKSAFVYNILRFVRWPEQDAREVRFCVIGTSPMLAEIPSIDGKDVGDRVLRFAEIAEASELEHCDAVFVGEVSASTMKDIEIASAEHHILTIGDKERFAAEGGIVNLVVVDNKIRFEINLAAATASRIELNARLVDLAIKTFDK